MNDKGEDNMRYNALKELYENEQFDDKNNDFKNIEEEEYTCMGMGDFIYNLRDDEVSNSEKKLYIKYNQDKINKRYANEKYTPLIYICKKTNNIEIVRTLLEYGANINSQTLNGSTALLYAVKGDIQYGIVKLLLENGADPNICDDNGNSPLLFASYLGYLWMVSLLVKYNADTNIQNNVGETALMKACYNNDESTVRILLEHGANPNIQDDDGNTALQIAQDSNNTDIINLLLEYRAVI